MSQSLSLCTLPLIFVLTQSEVASSIARWSLSSRMQSFKKRNQGSRLRRTQILSVGGHVAAALDHLSNQLILRQPHGHRVERRAALSPLIAERVAVVALLHLKNQGALPLERGPVVQKLRRNRNAAPCT